MSGKRSPYAHNSPFLRYCDQQAKYKQACKNGAQNAMSANHGPTSTPLSYGVAGVIGCAVGMIKEHIRKTSRCPNNPLSENYDPNDPSNFT